jgi:predicted phosphoribosyltransferase
MYLFKNRTDAALQLCDQFSLSLLKNPLVLAIPRGGVPIGSVLARQLKGDLDIVLVHKLGAPGQPELAIGAVDESGNGFIHDYAQKLGVSEHYLEEEKLKQLKGLRKRRKLFTPHRQPLDPSGRDVLIVDDGIATGSTMVAALRSLKKLHPRRLIVTVPVASPSALREIAKYADQVVCLFAPEPFFGVGQFYEDFSQVSDEEVIQILSQKEVKSA